ncbi:MAG: TolC family protein [Gammaproteobacteria bacterium]
MLPLTSQGQDGAQAAPTSAVEAEEPRRDPLPEPFTLDDAVALGVDGHPSVRQAEAGIGAAEASRLEADALNGFEASVFGRLRYVDPSPVAANQTNNDSSFGVRASKRLYDFGRGAAETEAAEAQLQGAMLAVGAARDRQTLEVLRRYFDVIEADLAFNVANEGMSIAFVTADKLKDRQELGQVSDIDVLEADARFQDWRVRVRKAETRQRATRALLAAAYNRPLDLASTVVPAELVGNDRELEEFDVLLSRTLRSSPELTALNARVEAAEARVRAAEAEDSPVLRAEFDATEYNRDFSGRDQWGAALVLEVPLFTGGRAKAKAARRGAELLELEARRDALILDLRQRLLEAWLRVDTARAEVERAVVQLDFRDLYLDRSRALYALEVRSDLGDSMTRWSEAKLDQAQARHALAMAFAHLDALTGDPIVERLQGRGTPQTPEPEEASQ